MKTLFAPVRARLMAAATQLLLVTLLLGSQWACNQPNDVTPNTTQSEKYRSMRASFNALEGEWLLTTYQNAPLPASLQNQATLVLKKQADDRHQIGGRSFVNWYGGTFRLDETKGLIVSTDPIHQTLMAGSPEQMQAEARHMDGLKQATYFELAGNELRLYLGEKGNAATEVMIFSRK